MSNGVEGRILESELIMRLAGRSRLNAVTNADNLNLDIYLVPLESGTLLNTQLESSHSTMEDPWASGPVYDQTAKPANQLPRSPSPIRSAPVSDPWGEPIPTAQSRPDVSPGGGWASSPPKVPTADLQIAAPSWGGGWDEQPEAGPSRSPIRRPADSPEWSTSNPQEQDDTNHGMALPDLDTDQTMINRSSSPAEDFPSPTGGFTQDTTPASPKSAIPELGGFDEPSLPTSPTFGDDFGGFSSFGDDPWGPKKEGNGWGQSSDRQSTDRPDPDTEDEVEPEDGDGWGRSIPMERGEETKNTQVGMDQEWEEAQKRIKVTEQRAVSFAISQVYVPADKSSPGRRS